MGSVLNSTVSSTEAPITLTSLFDGEFGSSTSFGYSSSTTSDSSFTSLPENSSPSPSSTALSVVTPSLSSLEESYSLRLTESRSISLPDNSTTISYSSTEQYGSESSSSWFSDSSDNHSYSDSTIIISPSTFASPSYASSSPSSSSSLSSAYSNYATSKSKSKSATATPQTTALYAHETTSSTTSSSSSSYTSSTSSSSSSQIGSITYTYDQIYYITGSTTSFSTDLTITRTLPSNLEFNPATDEPITTDISFFNAYFSDVTHASTPGPRSDNQRNTIIGSVVGSILGFGLVLFLMWLFLFRKRKGKVNQDAGFSHSIATTRMRHYRSTDNHEKEEEDVDLYFNPLTTRPSLTFTNSANSVGSDELGLNSLRHSILQDQTMDDSREFNSQYYNEAYNQSNFQRSLIGGHQNRSRGIETVVEEMEPEHSSIAPRPTHPQNYSRVHSKSINSSRYQNAGLQLQQNILSPPIHHSINSAAAPAPISSPFDDAVAARRTPPTPPPSRKQAQYHSQSVAYDESRQSVDSSIVSDDTDLSTDDSLLQPDGTLGNGDGSSRSAFFKEIV